MDTSSDQYGACLERSSGLAITTRAVSCPTESCDLIGQLVHSGTESLAPHWWWLSKSKVQESAFSMPSLVTTTDRGHLTTRPSRPPTTGAHHLILSPSPASSFTFVLLSLLLLSFIHLAIGLPTTINVGAVFTEGHYDQEVAFQLAIKRINADQIILPHTRLVPKIERIQKHDSFHANKKVCGLLKTGVVAIFDPLDGHISRHVQSICDALDIPHIETRWDFKLKRNDLSINLYPRPSILVKAYVDIVKAWQWEQFVIVYEDNEGLYRLQDFFKEAQARNWHIKLYQFEVGKPYRETFWKIKEEGEHNIILDVKNENIYRALKHAQQVGLITESHSYLITQLDLHTIDLEDFKFGKTKITAFSLVDNKTEEHQLLMADWKENFPSVYTGEISTESALLYDAVRLLATAIQDLDQSQSIDIQPVSCETAVPWSHGSSLINYMRPITFRGLTGLVEFNDQGFRSGTTLGILTVNQYGLEDIGTWSEDLAHDARLNISREFTSHYSNSALQNKTLIITTIINDPYTMIKPSSFKRIGNDRFEGYAIDLISELAKLLHFKYEFRLVKDGAYGRPDKSGVWNGMMGELIRGEADLAVADLTITSKREDAVDFTHPFMNTGISILFKKPTKKVTSLFSFLSPFSNTVWIYVLCAYVGVSSMLFIVGRLSPYEWENPHPCRHDEQVLENGFSLSNSFWFTIGSLMQQASDLTPKAMSTRTIAAIWYFFTLIMIASYTANLAAFLTVEKIVYPIENAEGLSNQEKIKYGCLGSGSTASFFAESNISTYKRMWDFMSRNPDVYMRSNEEGRLAVEKKDGSYAFLMESASIQYTVERNCNLTQIGGLLDSKGYGVATAKDSPFRMPLSQAILQLQESGDLLILKERWWKQRKGGGQCIDDSKKGSGTVMPLKIDNVGGVFVVLLGGLSFSLFVAILEFIWRSRNDLQQESVCEEMINDLKFAFLCQSSSKFIKPKVPIPPSPEVEQIEYYPQHYQRSNYPPLAIASTSNGDPYCVNSPSCSNSTSNNNKRMSNYVHQQQPSHSRQTTPKSRSGSRMSSAKMGSEVDIRPLNEASHRNSSRVPLVYHYDDCALVNSSNSALNYCAPAAGPSTSKGTSSQYRSASSNRQSSGRSVQYLLNHSQSTATTNSSSGKAAVRVMNGARVVTRGMAASQQSNSCSDLIMHEVSSVLMPGPSCGGTGGGGVLSAGVMHRGTGGASMRSVGKMYSQSLDDELAHAVVLGNPKG